MSTVITMMITIMMVTIAISVILKVKKVDGCRTQSWNKCAERIGTGFLGPPGVGLVADGCLVSGRKTSLTT